LTSRSVVFPAGVTLKVLALDNVDEPFISADGQPAFSKIPDFPIQISLARETFPLLEVNDHSHFRVLRNKLKWG
jgi:NAD kinase